METNEWHRRVCTSFISVTVIDAHLLHCECALDGETFNEFTHYLANDLIECGVTTSSQRQFLSCHPLETPQGPKRRWTPNSAMQQTPTKKRDNGKENERLPQTWCV